MYWITNYSKGLILICFACVGLWKEQIQCSRSKDAFGISGRPLMTRILVNCWKTVRTVNRRRPSIVQETRLSSTRVWPSLRAMGFTSVYTGTYLAEWQILIQVSSWLCPSVHFPHCTIQIRATFTGILHPRQNAKVSAKRDRSDSYHYYLSRESGWSVLIEWQVRKCRTEARWSRSKAKKTFHIASSESKWFCWVCFIGEFICCAFCFTRNVLPSKIAGEDISHLPLINLIRSIWINLTSPKCHTEIVLFAGQIKMGTQSVTAGWHQCRGDDLFERLYFVLTDKSPAINLLFAARFDLIIFRSTERTCFFPLLKVASSMPYFPRRFPRSRTTSARNGLLAPRS